ncbi:hypothetical protein SERLA73DRAFT_120049 [Serpula lacrymans var. lacrymans S7.3]|uniref:(2E,6E)-farnesyl diphosphate synthase n=2 Tax=Serpula lacrymans var. lacrymans TaxID=341189 RepID=F8PN82_SERL3|nr:uncharacterized protein SERLADRAFT_380984 [Serpula lacrymans var. lacrymans S7.9]EGO03064.1 hypothetical protein SERLA73DRAFT_120049 [Serpula lacrymans var. lacrymans S7.3]EGO28829.1 hypothetical protein SERLADRAFT_380984 [Serpula lacrymans var. lacrymans S7.9]
MAVAQLADRRSYNGILSGLVSYFSDAASTMEETSYDFSKPLVPVNVSFDYIDGKTEITLNDEEKLLEPFTYYRHVLSGKGLRKALLNAFNHHLGLPQVWIDGIVSIIEDLHNSSLLIDDIEDGSPLRRGSPTAHIKYGVAPAINSGNYVYFLTMAKAAALASEHGADSSEMTRVFIDEMLELHRGQGMEIWWRQNRVCPTVEQYLLMAERKTAGLLRLGVRLMQCHPKSPAKVDLSSLAVQIGVYYQIRDDYINLASTNYTSQKGFAEDISEGKYGFPMIHSLMAAPNSGLAQILDQKPEAIPMKRKAIDIIRRTGSFEATVECLVQLRQRLQDTLVAAGRNPGLERFLAELSIEHIE